VAAAVTAAQPQRNCAGAWCHALTHLATGYAGRIDVTTGIDDSAALHSIDRTTSNSIDSTASDSVDGTTSNSVD
jgi:hypothetical protein